MPTGTMKWSDADKGFGAISVGRDGPDAFVHHTVTQTDGSREPQESQRAEFDTAPRAKGPQAEAVRPI